MDRGAGKDGAIVFQRGGPTFILAALTLCCLACGTRASGPGRVRMTTSLGLAGHVVPGRWTPLTVRIEGAAHPVTVEIVKDGAVEQFSCQRERYSLECPVFIEETGGEIVVRLREGRRILVEQTLNPAVSLFPGHLVLVVDVPSRVQLAVAKALLPQEPVAAANLSVEGLPRHAWSYDGVSCLVLRDPGPGLDPAQARALRAWLAGGGRLLLLDRRPGGEGLWSMFSPADWSGRYRFGLGEVAEAGREAEDPALVRRILGLVPFAEAKRLTPGQCFIPPAAGNPVRQRPGRIRPIMAGWFLCIILAGMVLGRKKALPPLILATLVWVTAAVPIGGSLAREWRRGAITRTRAVILPADGGAFAKTEIRLARSVYWLPNIEAPSWEVGLRFRSGEESGWFVAGETFAWRHDSSLPSRVVTDSGSTLGLAGFIPAGPALADLGEDAPVAGYEMVLWKRGRWFVARTDGLAGPEWNGAESMPSWLAEDEAWLDRLFALYPHLAWLVGRGSLCLSQLSVEGAADRNTLWVRPLLEVAR